MARLTKEQWHDARIKWENDPRKSYEWLAIELGISRPAVSKMAASQGWRKNEVTNKQKLQNKVTKVTKEIKTVTSCDVEEKKTQGRPSKYMPEYDDQAYRFCLMGATDLELAEFFDVEESTINNWKVSHPTFLESIRNGKENADAKVVESLYKRALGYCHDAEKVFCNNGEVIVHEYTERFPPETAAIRYWLNNRQRDKWKDRVDTQVEVSVDKNTLALIESQFITRMAEAVSRQSAIYSERNIIDVAPE